MDTRIYEVRARSLKFPDITYYGSETEEFKSAVAQYHQDKNKIFLDFQEELLCELMIKNHPNSEYFLYLLDQYSGDRFEDSYNLAKDLVKLMEVKHAKEN